MENTLKVYSIREAAIELGVSRTYVYYLRDTGQIKVEQIGAQYVITQDEINRYLAALPEKDGLNNHRKGNTGNNQPAPAQNSIAKGDLCGESSPHGKTRRKT